MIELIEKLENMMTSSGVQPNEIYDLAEDIIKNDIPYGEKEIKELSDKVGKMKNDRV